MENSESYERARKQAFYRAASIVEAVQDDGIERYLDEKTLSVVRDGGTVYISLVQGGPDVRAVLLDGGAILQYRGWMLPWKTMELDPVEQDALNRYAGAAAGERPKESPETGRGWRKRRNGQ